MYSDPRKINFEFSLKIYLLWGLLNSKSGFWNMPSTYVRGKINKLIFITFKPSIYCKIFRYIYNIKLEIIRKNGENQLLLLLNKTVQI